MCTTNYSQLILASSSPRRRSLLAMLGLPFSVAKPDDNAEPQLTASGSGIRKLEAVGLKTESLERMPGQSVPPAITEEVMASALAKARSCVPQLANEPALIIGADTVVVLESAVLGKPQTPEEAKEMLACLSGRWHRVVTALALIDNVGQRFLSDYAETAVKFRELDSAEIAAYVACGEPLDKAGAYGIQERGSLLVEKIDGCYFNVVGLPIGLLKLMLRQFGYDVWQQMSLRTAD